MVTPRVEKGTDCLQRGMAKRAGVIDRCAPLERRRVQGVMYGPALVARTTGYLRFLGHRIAHAHFSLNQLLPFDTSGNQIIHAIVTVVTPCGGEPSM